MAPTGPNLAPTRTGWVMPKNIAQWTGVVVTAIVTFGADMDVLHAVPLGIFAGMTATFFVGLTEAKQKAAKISRR